LQIDPSPPDLQIRRSAIRSIGKRRIGPQPLQLGNKVPLPANASVAFVNENFRARQLFFEIGRHDG
jgi:hypothetical protein